MRRFVSWVFAVLSISLSFGGLTGCGGGSATGTAAVPTPAKITLAPGDSSIDIGTTLQFAATPVTAAGGGITTLPIVYSSSNPAVLSFVPTAGGLACAGKWDTAGRVCTPQGTGVAQVTASGNGVSSPPVTVYVHQHIDQVTVTQFRAPNTPPQPDCVTLAQAPGIQNYLDFQANAFRLVDVNGTPTPIDITNTVGSFTFSQTNAAVAKISTTDPELNNNNGNQITQARVTASAPGLTQVFASVSGVSSLPAQIPDNKGQTHPYFETCLVQSINLQVGNSAGNTSFAVTNNTSGITITPTVIDRLGNKLTNPVPKLDWISLSPQNASLSPNASTSGSTLAGTATVKASVPGGTGIVATCVAPNCNVGLQPTQAVYSSTNPSGNNYLGTPIIGLITGSPVTSGNVFVTTTQCGTINGCQPLIFPISIKTNAAGNSTTLPSSPNSMLFSPTGKSIFLGSSGGLMIFNPATTGSTSTVSQLTNTPGKVLAVSLDGDKVVVSDILSVPNQVYILSGLAGTGAPVLTPFLISGATAAAFSPDGLKAFIAAGSNVYVYSPVQSLKAFPAAANAVSFYANGALAYLSGPSGVSMHNACDTTYAQAASFPSGTPALFQVLSDGVHALGLESPGVDVFDVQVLAPTPATASSPNDTTCPFTVNSANSTFVNIGQGDFVPLKLIVASDNSKAYILASNLGSVFVFDLGVNTVTALPLTGNPVPLDASLTSDGTTLYVGAADGAIHVVSTVSGGDLQQITFTNNNNSNKTSLCSNIPQTCNPDLVAVQP